ncbi:Sprouty-related; EVH1 domain-containing protein 2 [Camelus dromedarius]|uniref:Sprouty-related n=1 Tax=Camelus dromedarius TaxID=9838 RepID=A0A5N4C2H4_CAMDR|nr:Sprouty-related; EVH1 domain-containing protein 2 [Camelus dromedarius]
MPRPYCQVSSWEDDKEETVCINPREKIWMARYEDYPPARARSKYLDSLEDADYYMPFAKGEIPKHDYNYPFVDPDFGICAGGGGREGSVIRT